MSEPNDVQDAMKIFAAKVLPRPSVFASRAGIGQPYPSRHDEMLAAIRDQTQAMIDLAEVTARHGEILAANTSAIERQTRAIEESWRRHDDAESEGEEWKDADA